MYKSPYSTNRISYVISFISYTIFNNFLRNVITEECRKSFTQLIEQHKTIKSNQKKNVMNKFNFFFFIKHRK